MTEPVSLQASQPTKKSQRFGAGLNLNLHFHCTFLDGIYTRGAVSVRG